MKTITAIYDFFFHRSTDQIVGKLGRMVRKLDKHEAKQFARRQRKMVKAARLTARSEAHRVEAEKAANVRQKIADLIG